MGTYAQDRSPESLSVQRMDYSRLLQRSREAFEEGDPQTGLQLLQMAATLERDLAGPRSRAPGALSPTQPADG